jgi:alkylhydroperoxidase family enzyme
VQAVLDDYRTAPISDSLKAMLCFLEKLTLQPEDVTAEDVIPLHGVGLNDMAIEEAIYVCATFNILDRLADSFGFRLLDEHGYGISAKHLLTRGYE